MLCTVQSAMLLRYMRQVGNRPAFVGFAFSFPKEQRIQTKPIRAL
jgi:hypothetical protein